MSDLIIGLLIGVNIGVLLMYIPFFKRAMRFSHMRGKKAGKRFMKIYKEEMDK